MKNNVLFSQLNLLIVSILKMVKIRISSFNLKLLPFFAGIVKEPSFLIKIKQNEFQFLLLTIFYLLSTTTLSAQFFESRTYGGTESDAITSVDSDENRNLYITGTFRQQMSFGQQTITSNGDDDVFIAHLDSTGLPIWTKSFGSISNDEASDIAYKNGFIYTSGFFWDSISIGTTTLQAGFGGSALYLSKLDAVNGNLIWSKVIEGDGIKEITDIEIDDDLNVYITGHYNQTIIFDNATYQPNGNISGFIAKYDENGTEQWTKNLGQTASTYGKHILADSNMVYLVGNFDGQVTVGDSSFTSGANDNNGFLAKWTSMGQFQWAKEMTGVGDLDIADIEIYEDELFIAGHYQNSLRFDGNLIQSPTIDYNIFIAKYTEQGGFLNVLNLGNSSNEFLTSMEIAEDKILAGGYFFGENHFNGTSSPLAFNGNTLAASSYGLTVSLDLSSAWADYFYALPGSSTNYPDVFVTDVNIGRPLEDPNIGNGLYRVVVGNFENSINILQDSINDSNGSFDFFIAHMPAYILTSTEIIIENEFNLKLYPNPAGEQLTVKMPVNEGEIYIYNSLGQQVLLKKVNDYQQNINISHLPSGVYFLSVESDERRITKSFIKNY